MIEEKIVEKIKDIIFGIISSAVNDKIEKKRSKEEDKKCQEKISSWISNFFSTHVEVVFESSQFENYLRYNKPFEKIRSYVLDAYKNNVTDTEKSFINNLALDCKKAISSQGGKCSSSEESSIRDLFGGVLSLIKDELRTKLSDGDQLLSYQINQNHVQLSDIQSQLNAIVSNFSSQTQVTDPLIIENAYNLMSKAMLQGEFEMVYNFLPVIKGKNEDLERSVKIKLNILSNYNIHIENQYAELSSIINPVLRDDIIKTLIVEYYFEPDEIAPLVELISDETLKGIAKAVSENHIEEIISKKVKVYNGATAITFEILKGYDTEKVLVNKLLVLYISALKIRGYNYLKETIVEPDIFDDLYIWEHCFNEIIFSCSDVNYGENKELTLLLEELKKDAEKYYNAKTTYAVRFYSLLLKISELICSNEFKDTFAKIPKHISDEPEIVEIQMVYSIHAGMVSSDEVLNFSIINGRYRAIAEYCIYLNNEDKIFEFIDKALFLLEKDFQIFIIYVDSISKVKGKKEAFSMLKKHETNYSIYPAFWIRAYFNSENESDQQWAIDSITYEIENKKFAYNNIDDLFTLIKILLKERKHETALQLINFIEYSWGVEDNADVICMKIEALLFLERHIEALDEMNKHPSVLTDNIRILDSFLCISLNNNRPIPEDIVFHAKKSNDARILLLVAEVERNNKNTEMAKIFAMKSLLNITKNREDLFDGALKFFLGDEENSQKQITRIDANMTVVLENVNDSSREMICIYRDRILPYSGYKWQDAFHIYIDDEFGQNFFRLSIGETVEYNNTVYKVIDISPIEAFYFNICMNSMVKRKTAFSISVDNENDIIQGIINLFHDHPEFNSKHAMFDYYTNFSHIPPTIYSLKHGINMEYAQLTRSIIEDPSVIVREFILPFNNCNGQEFVLTYTALAAIHLLGVSTEECKMCNIIISDSVLFEAKKEAKAIYDTYNKELVMSMKVDSDNLFVSKSDENNKRVTINVANSFMNFVSGFIGVENKNDMQLPQLNNKNMIDLLGICDYDSLIIAHQRKSVLVTGEMLPAEITLLNEIKADVVGIADFLCFLKLPAIKLISIIGKMVDYRFNAAITPTVIIYLSSCYDESDVSTQEKIIEDWRGVLLSLNNIIDEKQRNNYKSTCIEVISLLNGFKQGEGHPIVREYTMFSFYYNDYRIHRSLENGKIISTVYQIDNVNPTKSSKAISRIETPIFVNDDSFPNK